MKSSYNERFLFNDPKQSACRSTRHRAAKRKATELEYERHYSISTISEPTISEFDHHGDNAEICERETAIIHLGDDLESHRPSNPATATQECIEITTTASQSQDSKSGDKQCHSDISFLNVDFPLSLEYSSLCSNNNEHIHTINDPEDFECDRQEDSSNVTTWNPQQLPLYEGSALTCASNSILMLKYAMKHNITKDALADLLDLIKLHCPKPNTCPPTLYYFNKQFQNLYYPCSDISLLLQ